MTAMDAARAEAQAGFVADDAAHQRRIKGVSGAADEEDGFALADPQIETCLFQTFASTDSQDFLNNIRRQRPFCLSQ